MSLTDNGNYFKKIFSVDTRARNYNASLKLGRLKLSIDISTCYIKWINVVLVVKDIVVIYPKSCIFLYFNKFETLIFASWKINT